MFEPRTKRLSAPRRLVNMQGERVVRGQRVLQAASDVFLGWATAPSGRYVYIRQLRDMKLSANVELFDNNLLDGYARLCGWYLPEPMRRLAARQ